MTESLRHTFCGQRWLAVDRGIRWQLTFEEWLQWWMDSGHLHERGRKRGQYVMARIGDKGAYELGNIKCVKTEDNVREGIRTKKRLANIRWHLNNSIKTREINHYVQI